MTTNMILVLCTVALCVMGDVSYSYHWHMDQPIYWSVRSGLSNLTYQKAWESHVLKSSQGGHPYNQLQQIFGEADRVNDYTGVYPLAGASTVGGAQVSFSGCLMENVDQLSQQQQWGYAPGWQKNYITANSMRTSDGLFPRLDLVQFPYHHSLATLVDKASLKKQIQIHQVAIQKYFGLSPSKGFFPPEMSFTERAIPILAELGIEWSIVSNLKLSRACTGYPFSPTGDNIGRKDRPPRRVTFLTLTQFPLSLL